MHLSRRKFFTLAATSAAGTALLSPLEAFYARAARGQSLKGKGYGSLQPQLPQNVRELPGEYQKPLIALPPQFQYTAFSITGQPMTDGNPVPGDHDGMEAFPGPGGLVYLVRNHELSPNEDEFPAIVPAGYGYDPFANGGTTTLVVGRDRRLIKDMVSLGGTYRNCSGGPTPWNTYITCEENTSKPGDVEVADPEGGEPGDPQERPSVRLPDQDIVSVAHGYNFEVDPKKGLVKAEPIKAMGRFNHEAIAVDSRTGIVYQTEDRGNSVFYRYVPNEPGNLLAGGSLEALAIQGKPGIETAVGFPLKTPFPVEWIPLEDVESPEDDLRKQAADKGAAIFTRGEGMTFDPVNGEVFFCCTNGGEEKLGQIWRYVPDVNDATGGNIELFVEPNDKEVLEAPDNITVSPFGDLFTCEDGSGTDRLVGITPDGLLYEFIQNNINNNELAGVTFSPDGQTMFFNIQDPGITFAVWGPWQKVAQLSRTRARLG